MQLSSSSIRYTSPAGGLVLEKFFPETLDELKSSISVAKCSLSVGKTSKMVMHPVVNEIWICIEGIGEVSLLLSDENNRTNRHFDNYLFSNKQKLNIIYGKKYLVQEIHPGELITIPKGVPFQYRSVDFETNKDFVFWCFDLPPWKSKSDAIELTNRVFGPLYERTNPIIFFLYVSFYRFQFI
jgi:mannose-6-phosphate isomerase-like protein (cupin superfamily)